jgi:hypothetical protein
MQRRTILTGTALGVAGAAFGLSEPARARSGGSVGGLVAVRGVTVIDAVGGVRRGQTVLLRGDRILDVGPVRQMPRPRATAPVAYRGCPCHGAAAPAGPSRLVDVRSMRSGSA